MSGIDGAHGATSDIVLAAGDYIEVVALQTNTGSRARNFLVTGIRFNFFASYVGPT